MQKNESEPSNDLASGVSKRPWTEMKIAYLGQVSEVLRGGGGKISGSSTDPGDSRKTPVSG